jgi:hypothetical protein
VRTLVLWLVAGWAAAAVSYAAVVNTAPSRFDRAVVSDPSWRLGQVAETPESIPGFEERAAAWKAFTSAHGPGWNVFVDRRSGTPLLVAGPGLRWVQADAPTTVAELAAKAQALVAANEGLFAVRSAELVLNTAGSALVDKDHAILVFNRAVGGIAVDGEQILFNVTRGNLVAFGTSRWGAIDQVPEARYGEQTARDMLYNQMGILPKDVVTEVVPAQKLLVAGPSADESSRRFLRAAGTGITHRLVWRIVLHVAGERGTWRGDVDATTGEIVALVDDTKYAQAKGGVYPVSDDQLCPDGCEQTSWPMPFADITIVASNQTAGEMGGFDCSPSGGTATSTLAGPYVRVQDVCGVVSESTTCDNDLDFRQSPGNDCAVPPGSSAGNTHSARTGFYHLNRISAKGRSWLPSNTWLQSQLTDNVNLNQTCNAYWNGSTVNFFKSGGGCNNTGEIAGVFLHEWGHGLDENDGGGYDDPTEAYADITALISTHVSCVGRGFYQSGNCSGYGDACLNCTGIRDQDWDQHASHTPATPSGFVTSDCGGGDSPCGREQHCETYVSAEAIFDLATRDLPAAGMDLATAWQLTQKLWYESRQGSGGNAYNCSLPSSDGCGAGSWFTKMRNIDDEDGNLSNGTPHAAAIFAAFNRHKIACGAAGDASNQSTSSCSALARPTLTAQAGSSSVTLSWSPVPGAVNYLVLRNDQSCASGHTIVATVAAPTTSYTDSGLSNGFTVYYAVQAQGGNTACESAVSACSAATPQPFAGSIKLDRAAYACQGGTINITVRDANIGASTTTATVFSDAEPTPETVILTETPPGSAKYIGSIGTTTGPAVSGDGLLSVQTLNTITAQYIDADDGQGGFNLVRQATATSDCTPPQISGIGTTGVTDVAATVAWSTDEASDSRLHWGPQPPPGTTNTNGTLVTQHSISLTGLTACTAYYYSVESQDASGNVALDDRAGQYYRFETLGDFGNGLQPCHAGQVTLGKSTVGCSDSLPIQVIDIDLNVSPSVIDTVTVTVSSSTEPYGETVTLTETGPNTSIFTGSIATSAGAPVPGNGILEARDGDLLTATYHDANDGTGSPAVSFKTAVADCAAPGVTSIQVTNITDESANVSVTTTEPSTIHLVWGTTPALGSTVDDPTLSTSHVLSLKPLAECGHFYFRITTTDVFGNARVLDLSGTPFDAVAGIIPSFFRDDFEGTPAWTLEGEWQIGAPQGKGSAPADPTSAFAGTKVLGQDLTGLGANPGDYEPGTTQSATSPVINAASLVQGQLKFRRWLNVGGGGISFVDVKKGSTWNQVWNSNSASGNTDTAWTLQTVDVSAYADGNASLQVRFRQFGGISPGAHRSGWNVDRFIIHSGTKPDFDVCGGCGNPPSFGGVKQASDVSGCADTGISLTWDAAVAWGTGHAGTYSVYRDVNPAFTPQASNRIATGVTGTGYTDAAAPNNVDLYYIVRAENDETCSTGPNNGGMTDANLVRAHAVDQLSQPAPGDLGGSLRAAVINAAHVHLSWPAVAGAASYHVERAQGPAGPFTRIADVAGTSYDDANALGNSANFYYRVHAADSCGNEGP